MGVVVSIQGARISVQGMALGPKPSPPQVYGPHKLRPLFGILRIMRACKTYWGRLDRVSLEGTIGRTHVRINHNAKGLGTQILTFGSRYPNIGI